MNLTDKEIKEGNKLIAEFCGLKPQSEKDDRYFNCPDRYYKYDIDEFKITNTSTPDSMLYHKDWNWLMPVLEIIESLGYTINIINLYSNEKQIRITNYLGYVCSDIKHDSKIIGIFLAVIDFIKWYNKQKDLLK